MKTESKEIDGMLFASTDLPSNSYLVRIHTSKEEGYNKMIVVVIEEETIHLLGWIGSPLTISQWKQAKSEFFPLAKRVRFERRKPDGSLKFVYLNLD